MRKSLGATKPKGVMKVKALLRGLRCDPASTVGATPARLEGFVPEAEQERTR